MANILCTALAALALSTLGGCSSTPAGLSSGLTARMDQPGARLDRTEALGILNQYRATTGAPALRGDAGLDAAAEALAATYLRTGSQPTLPAGAVAVRYSAGYANFAETFSGWRNSPPDAAVLAERSATRAGLAVVHDANSNYGVYWVLLLDD